MSWRPRSLRRWLSLTGNRGRGHGRPSYRRPPTPTASSPSRRVPLLRTTGPHQALVGSDAAATATTALEAKTPPALASPVNRSELSTESGNRRQKSTIPSYEPLRMTPGDSCRSCWKHLDGSARKREPSWNIFPDIAFPCPRGRALR